MLVSVANHLLHIHQVRGVGRQVVLDALLVADVNHQLLENAAGGVLVHRHAQPALQHILQQSYRLQAHRLATCVRAGDDKKPTIISLSSLLFPLSSQHNIQRHHLLLLLRQRELQQRVHGLYPVDVRLLLHSRFHRLRQVGQRGLGVEEVDDAEELVGLEDLVDMRAHLVAEHGEDADDLAALLGLQLADAVVGLHHLRRLDEHRLSCGTLVVHDAADAPFHAGRHGNHQTSVAHRRRCVLVHQAVALGCVKNRI